MIRDIFGKVYPLTYATKYKLQADEILSHRPHNFNEYMGLVEMLEFYSKPQYGFPYVNLKRLTPNLIDAILSIRKNGSLIGTMRGAIQWDWRWENSSEPVPNGGILKCLMRRNLLFMKWYPKGPDNERVFTDDWCASKSP